jgi:phenylacetate-CoA ligase
VDTYASGECGLIAATCPHCGRYHVQAECNHVEIIDDDGMAVAPGGIGEIVVTPLYNYTMPLIRYAHLDRAQVGRAGGCPVTLPVLSAILGKQLPPFRFRGGVVVEPIVPACTVVEFLGTTTFRFVQVDDVRCEFRLVPSRLAPADMRFDAMTEHLRKAWWPSLQVDYRILEQLPTEGHGKIKLYDREVSRACAGAHCFCATSNGLRSASSLVPLGTKYGCGNTCATTASSRSRVGK